MHVALCQETFVYRGGQHAGFGLQFADPAVSRYSPLRVFLLRRLAPTHSGSLSLHSSFLSYTFCTGKSFWEYLNFLYPQLRRKCSNDLTFVEISLWPGLTGIFSVHFIKSILLIEHKRSQMMCSRKQIISQMGKVGQWKQTWNFNPLFISSPTKTNTHKK